MRLREQPEGSGFVFGVLLASTAWVLGASVVMLLTGHSLMAGYLAFAAAIFAASLLFESEEG